MTGGVCVCRVCVGLFGVLMVLCLELRCLRLCFKLLVLSTGVCCFRFDCCCDFDFAFIGSGDLLCLRLLYDFWLWGLL